VKSSVRFLLALGAFFVAAAALSACGGVPGNSVARVDDTTIKKATFDHWMIVAAKSSQQPGSAAPAIVPDAPNYTKCVATLRKTLPKPAKGQTAPTTAQLRTQCKQQYEGLRDQVMQFLINAEWLRGEAADQDVKVSQAEITKSYNQQKAQQFPKPAAFATFLKQSGMTVQDLRLNVEVSLLSNKIRNKVTKGKGTATPAQISAYYNKNRQQFAQPESRDIDLLLTKTSGNAQKALAALKSGDDFKVVAKKYSVDPATKRQGGALTVTKGQQDPSFDKAVFGAPKGKLLGPVKTQFGYLVFQVNKITPAKQQTLAQATPQIRQQLTTGGQRKALQTFVKDFEKKWKGRTECRKGYIVQVCKNAPKPKESTSTAPPGAVPQTQSAPSSGETAPAPAQSQTTPK
jgi:parvulin-like peptidyl-prolyl isomerase